MRDGSTPRPERVEGVRRAVAFVEAVRRLAQRDCRERPEAIIMRIFKAVELDANCATPDGVGSRRIGHL